MKPVPHIDENALRESEKRHKKDTLANDEPVVLESSEYDPEFPALSEFEVDTDGPRGAWRKHPWRIWITVAVVAVVVLCIAFIAAGDWMNPTQAAQVQDAETNATL